MLRHAAVPLLLFLASPVLAQGTEFQQLLSGRQVPLNLTLKDLSGEWRRLSIGTTDAKAGSSNPMSQLMQAGMMADKEKGKGKEDAAAAMIGMSLLGGLFGGGMGESAAPVYCTKGHTLTIGNETFLIAYRYRKPETNLFQLAMESEKSGKDPDFAKMAADGKMTPDSPIRLSLLNLRSISAIDDNRPFDLNQEIAESGQSGGGLMELIAQEAIKEAAKEAAQPKLGPKPVVKPVAAKKPAVKAKTGR